VNSEPVSCAKVFYFHFFVLILYFRLYGVNGHCLAYVVRYQQYR